MKNRFAEIGDVRGLGAMMAFELVKDQGSFSARCRAVQEAHCVLRGTRTDRHQRRGEWKCDQVL